MAGQPGRSGNRTPLRGRKLVTRLELSRETALVLKLLIQTEDREYSQEAAGQVIERLIEREYAAYQRERGIGPSDPPPEWGEEAIVV